EYRSDEEMGVCAMQDVVARADQDLRRVRTEAINAVVGELRRVARLAPLRRALADTSTPRASLYCKALGAMQRVLGGPRPARAAERVASTVLLPSVVAQEVTTPAAYAQSLRAARQRAAICEVEIQKKLAISAACIIFALLGAWGRVSLMTLLGYPILAIVIDLTDKLDTYLGRGIKPAVVAWTYVFDLPEKMFLILPVAVLFATVFTVGALGRHSELTAAKASGISFHRLVLPLFAAAGAAFVAGPVLAEIAPVTTSRRLEMLGGKAIPSTTPRYNFAYRADRGWVYAIRALEPRTR